MRYFSLLLIVFYFSGCNSDRRSIDIPGEDLDRANTAFRELKAALKSEKGRTWDFSLAGPVMLVNRDTRVIIASEKDEAGELIKNGPVYVGILPDHINIANTALDWNGKRWTMVAFPLPETKEERLSLLIHESFHRIQPEIGFDSLNDIHSAHLDTKEGRIYLKLELEALKEALKSSEPEGHLKNALLFRVYRYQLFPEARAIENSLEINEGLAEYTGSILSQRSPAALKAHYISNIDRFYTFPSYVRSFAYFTIPVYGYFMQGIDEGWNKEITKNTNLTDFIDGFFDFIHPVPVGEDVRRIGENYHMGDIVKSETDREIEKEQLKNEYKIVFTGDSVVELVLENMNISFDPGNIVPLDSFGSVYPFLRITDNWGILEVDSGGALLSPAWNQVTISYPQSLSDSVILGRGWRLVLNDNWNLAKTGEKYHLKKE